MTTQSTWTKSALSFGFMLGLAAAFWLAASPGLHHEASAATVTNLPAPGAYVLHRIQRVPEARLLDADGKTVNLTSAARGAVTALGFFYGQCADPQGCPVAWSVFESARREADADALLKQKLRLVFISLDPVHDTPSVLRLLRNSESAVGTSVPWAFLTSSSYDELTPLLQEMGQDIGFETDAAGRRTGVINHMLKVFLIDPDGWVREIYTTAFLTSDSLLNDARTLAMTYPDH